ncbi:iron complex transport system permease protein [Oceanospirillum multiglobuliferum]|uniref:ABC transporter permease n=1 Tax=Oceanospirillum multiglobuliferum TaxID=64969 RepID=A0A1T4P411_9GAMM|nr:iron ABC transporter permease [Oceanospirillum multiglobuliferum]OPX54832.1 ABC transporter permease [Oceanospirillum multiglobuliferum]SJZ86253.1 iron complex transport system permease protein [Oceanospirillum multiglobuliferum]
MSNQQPTFKPALQRKQALYVLLLLSVAAMGSVALSLLSGSISVTFADLWQLLSHDQPTLTRTVVMELRLPRTLAALIVGAELAVAGCLMQVLLRNPLADPYVLGVSGGAAVGALCSISLGLGAFWISGSAFVGALVNLLLVFGLAHGQGSWSPTRLLLTGVVTASGWGAVVSFLLSIGEDSHLRGMLFWLMGDLSRASLAGVNLTVLLICLALSWALARPLNLMLRGELQAKALGVSVYPIQLTLYLLASALTASAVTQAGSVGFLGLVVPHILRLSIGTDHRVLLPAAALAGGTLLLLADTLARTLIAPQQLPVGVITAFIGVPMFLWVLQKSNRGQL